MSNLEKLAQPFRKEDVEWRVQSSGVKDNKPWAMVLAYVSARAVQNRLDEVFGVLGWSDTYRHVAGGVVCSLSAFNTETKEWVTKENGSPETQIEAFKGGISKAFVRVASSGFGVGRYLYDLDTAFVNHNNSGKRYDVIKDKQGKKIGEIKWNEPALPSWAVPSGSASKPQDDENPNPEKKKKFENAENYNQLAIEMQKNTNKERLDKWCAVNKPKSDKLSETDKGRLNTTYKMMLDMFKDKESEAAK